MGNFNPRSPRGERQSVLDALLHGFSISTHAPLAGSDLATSISTIYWSVFQPTLPSRGATLSASPSNDPLLHFNPRSPRGERRFQCISLFHFSVISTHAPLAGSDEPKVGLPAYSVEDFNPRSPRGERRRGDDTSAVLTIISTHAPLAGSDSENSSTHFFLQISTHAPLAGSDKNYRALISPVCISTHAPLAGSDHAAWSRVPDPLQISTHAPLAGSDSRYVQIHTRKFRKIKQKLLYFWKILHSYKTI